MTGITTLLDWSPFIAPAVVAALVSGLISVVGFFVSSRTARVIHRDRLAFDQDLSARKLEFDEKLSERKFEFDKQIIERKFSLDSQLADRKRKQDLAEEVLAGFYEARDIMRAVRSPGGFDGEGKSRTPEPGENENVARAKDSYYAIVERFDAHREPIAKLMSREYRMAAWFGKQSVAPFRTLHAAFVKVRVSARMLMKTAHQSEQGREHKSHERWESDIWEGLGEPDPIAAIVDKAIDDIESVCRAILQDNGRST